MFHMTRVPEIHSTLGGPITDENGRDQLLWLGRDPETAVPQMFLLGAGNARSLSDSCFFVSVKEHLVYHCSRLRPGLVWGNGRSLHPTSLTSWCIRGEARQTAVASSSPAFFLTERFTLLFCFILLWFFPVVSSGLALRMNSIRKHAGEDGKRILAKSQNGNNNTEIGVEPSPISPGCWEN